MWSACYGRGPGCAALSKRKALEELRSSSFPLTVPHPPLEAGMDFEINAVKPPWSCHHWVSFFPKHSDRHTRIATCYGKLVSHSFQGVSVHFHRCSCLETSSERRNVSLPYYESASFYLFCGSVPLEIYCFIHSDPWQLSMTKLKV